MLIVILKSAEKTNTEKREIPKQQTLHRGRCEVAHRRTDRETVSVRAEATKTPTSSVFTVYFISLCEERRELSPLSHGLRDPWSHADLAENRASRFLTTHMPTWGAHAAKRHMGHG